MLLIDAKRMTVLVITLTLSIFGYAQEKKLDLFYAEVLISDAKLRSNPIRGNFQFDNHRISPSFGLGLGYQHSFPKSSFYYDLALHTRFMDVDTKDIFLEPYGTVINQINLLNVSGSLSIGYNFAKFSFEMKFGLYANINVKSKAIQELDDYAIYEKDVFYLFTYPSTFKPKGFYAGPEILYKLNDSFELSLFSNVLYLEGRNPFNANGRRYLSLSEIGVGLRRYWGSSKEG